MNNEAKLVDWSLADTVSVVTGAGGGLGTIESCALAEAGSFVVALDIDEESAKRTVEEIESRGGKAVHAQVDLGNVDEIRKTFEWIKSNYGPVDVLVNNAAIARRAYALDATEKQFEELVAINVRGLYFAAQCAARQMKEANNRGRIINFASIGGQVVDGERSSIYDGTKAAVIQLTKNMAYEWGKYGVRANAIAPGYMRTQLIAEFLEDKEAEQAIIDANLPIGRIGEPEDLAGPIVFLASAASGFVTGHTLNVDGGWTTS